MKIRLLSDLHLEGYRFDYTHEGEDVLVLAGDIHTCNRHYQLIEKVPHNVQIVMVAGNHEYYESTIQDVDTYLTSLEVAHPNFKFLKDEETVIDGVHFFGGTMYTDFSLYQNGPIAEVDALRGISDFWVTRIWENGDLRRWTPEDHKKAHVAFKKAFGRWIKDTEGKKRVVVSHFVPTEEVIHGRWRMNNTNPYFTVDMTRFMGWEGLWLYGHTHDVGETLVGKTRVIGNPKGYGTENIHFNPKLIVEI